MYHGLPANQLAGITKPPSPFRKVEINSAQQQQQQQQAQAQARKSSSSFAHHYRPTVPAPAEPVKVPPVKASWSPAQPPSVPNDLPPRPGPIPTPASVTK